MTPPASGTALMVPVGPLSSLDSAGCFQNCSPIRTRCPGPAAQLSCDENGCWTAVCRRPT